MGLPVLLQKVKFPISLSKKTQYFYPGFCSGLISIDEEVEDYYYSLVSCIFR